MDNKSPRKIPDITDDYALKPVTEIPEAVVEQVDELDDFFDKMPIWHPLSTNKS